MLMHSRHCLHILLLIVVMQTISLGLRAQEYKVVSFRQLTNDVSAFITPVMDYNGDACALIKVVAPSEFAFSTPMGIVKRKDEVGEIWLFVPNETKSLTLKHPQWGVLRDYRFAHKLESHNTYEIRLSLPQPAVEIQHDTITMVRTVKDTIAVAVPEERPPLSIHTLATVSFLDNATSYGIMLGVMRKNGAFIHATTDLRTVPSTEGECRNDGSVVGETGAIPYYSGSKKQSMLRITGGVMQRLFAHQSSSLTLFEGVGYGKRTVAWQLAESDERKWLKNNDQSYSGVAFEAGCILSALLKSNSQGIDVMISTSTIEGKHWQVSVGLGLRF